MTVMLLSSLLGGAGYSSVLAAAKAYALWCEGNKTVYYVYGETAYAAGGTYDGQTITQVFENKVTESSIKSQVETVVLESSYCSSKPTNLTGLFSGMTNLTIITGLNNLDTSEATTMSSLFKDCQKLVSIDVSNFNTSKVTSMYSMFSGCNLLTSLDVSHFNTSKVTNMSGMFYACKELESIDVSHFDTSNIKDFGSMFLNCSALTSIDLSSFDTSNATNMISMFKNCQELISIDVSHFNTSNVKNMVGMFQGCSKLTSLDLRNFNTTNVTHMGGMFMDCSELTTIYCNDSWSATNSTDMFTNCSKLVGAIPYNSTKVTVEYANPTTGYFTSVGDVIHTTIQFSSLTATATYGQTFTPPTLTITPAGLPVTYESSDLSVAEVDASTGAITLVGAGSTVITASYEGDDDHSAASASYKLTVNRGTPKINFSQSSMIVTIGDDVVSPILTTTPENLAVTYSSGDPKVAEVDASTGAITLKKAGSTTITAAFAGNDNYLECSASYSITVVAKKFDCVIGGVQMNSDMIADNTLLTAALNGLLTSGIVVLTANADFTELTLTLTDAKIQSDTKNILSNSETLNIVLNGSNEMTTTSSSLPGINNLGVINISGTGQLKATGYIGVSNKGTMTLNGGTLEATSNNIGFYGEEGSTLAIKNGTLKATGTGHASVEIHGTLTLNPDVVISQPAGAVWNSSKHAVCDAEGNAVTTQVIITGNAVANDLAFASATASAKMGADFTAPVLSNPHNLAVSYTSSKTDVATVDANGKVTLVKPGETVITASFAGNADYLAGSASYTLTVAKGDPSISYSEATASVVFGAELSAPTLTVTPESLKNNITITSSNTAVAKITGLGDVTVVGAGETTIKAAFAGDDYYNAAEASYKLTVTAAAATLTFAQTDCSTTVGASFNSPELSTTPASLKVKYSSSDPDLATVSEETGVVVAKAEGVVTITATSADVSYTGSASYKLTITRSASGLQFASATATATYGADFTAPELKNEHSLSVRYESSNTAVATVEEFTGKVILLKAGETTITARFAGNDEYEPASASYVLTVKKAKATLTFAQTECTGVVREDFTPPTLTVNPAGLEVRYSSNDTDVAGVNDENGFVVLYAEGEVIITATVVSEQYEGEAFYKITVVAPAVDGDANGDGEIDVADIDFVIEHIGEDLNDNNKAADVNADDAINVADVDYIIERIK